MKLLFENWREYLNEQPKDMAPFATGDEREEQVNKYYERWKKDLQDTGEKFGSYKILSYDAGDGIVYFLMDEDERPKLYLFLDGEKHTSDPVMKAEDAKDIYTSDFYKYLIKKHDFISSGTDQTPDSRRVWDRLESDPELEVEVIDNQKKATIKNETII
jgi:hypothetical protein